MREQIQVGVRTRFVAGGGFVPFCVRFAVSLRGDAPEGTTSAQSELACHDKIAPPPSHAFRDEPHGDDRDQPPRVAGPREARRYDGGLRADTSSGRSAGTAWQRDSEECDGADLKGLTCEAVLGSVPRAARGACSGIASWSAMQCQLCGNGFAKEPSIETLP